MPLYMFGDSEFQSVDKCCRERDTQKNWWVRVDLNSFPISVLLCLKIIVTLPETKKDLYFAFVTHITRKKVYVLHYGLFLILVANLLSFKPKNPDSQTSQILGIHHKPKVETNMKLMPVLQPHFASLIKTIQI